MYLVTAGSTDTLTLNASYPSCHAKSRVCWFIHREELDFRKSIAFANGNVGVDGTARVRGPEIPPTATGIISWFLQTSALKVQSLAISCRVPAPRPPRPSGLGYVIPRLRRWFNAVSASFSLSK